MPMDPQRLSGNGIVHNGGNAAGPNIHLPLEELHAKILILDVSARVTLTQVYSNPSSSPTSRAVYYFSVPQNAAICAFGMHTSDGRTLKGIAKDKAIARAEFEEAIKHGQNAGLLQSVSDDVFTIVIGSIPAGETVETRLTYIMSLMNDDNIDEVRFHLPVCVGQRYGETPLELRGALSPSALTRVRVTADIQTSGRIETIKSPSHPDEITETRYPTHLGRASRRRSTVKLRSQTLLEKDFVLIIRARGLDAPRCFAELERNEDSGVATLAMQLVVMPKFGLSPISRQEYLFLVDRSGSMQLEERVGTAKNTLTLLLRMLPSRETLFNIFSFGSSVQSLWTTSRQYNRTSLDEATSHVEGMEANLGGTEIGSALQHVLSTRTQTMPTAVFVLTDGEVQKDVYDQTILSVKSAVSQAKSHAFVKVYCLGIGGQVSTALCEGIANAGNGACLFAVTSESIVGKCARLFRAGRIPAVEDVSIDWGISQEHLQVQSGSGSNVNFFDHSPAIVRLRPTPVIQQSPSQIQTINAGMRLAVFAIIKLKTLKVPKQVILRGHLQETDEDFELKVPVRDVQLANSTPLPLVHTLAASHLVRDHEAERGLLPSTFGPASNEARRKAAIIRLAERYQLASQFTSFVVVDSDQCSHLSRPPAKSNFGSWGSQSHGSFNQWRDSASNDFVPLHETCIPGAWPDTSYASSPHVVLSEIDNDDGYTSTATFTTLSSLESWTSDWSDWSTPSLSEADQIMLSSPIPALHPASAARQSDRPIQSTQKETQPIDAQVLQLLKSQLFDGSFSLEKVGEYVAAVNLDCGVDSRIWATVLAVAFISKRQVGLELLEDLLVKAREFLDKSADQSDIDELLKRADALVR